MGKGNRVRSAKKVRKINRGKKINHGFRAEKKSAKRLGMLQTPGSGNKFHSKGDFKDDKFLVEHKATEKQKISIKVAWLNKIIKEAIQSNRIPVLMFTFTNGHTGDPIDEGSYLMIPLAYANSEYDLVNRKDLGVFNFGYKKGSVSFLYSKMRGMVKNARINSIHFCGIIGIREVLNPAKGAKVTRYFCVIPEYFFKEVLLCL